MTAKILLLGAAALAFAPTVASSQTLPPPPGNGQYNGAGYWHQNSGAAVGQPGVECEDLIEDEGGATPGNSGTAPGGGSPFTGEDSVSGTHYAGSQAQNSRNTASVSQYDVACEAHPQ